MSTLLRKRHTADTGSAGGGGGVSPLSPSEFTAFFDPSTFIGAARPSGRIVCHGHHFAPGEQTDTVPTPSFYGSLSWSGPDGRELHAGAVDGDTLRFGIETVDGLEAFRIRTHFDADALYQYQGGPYNSSVYPPHGDPLYTDGTRFQIDFAEGVPGDPASKFIRSGPGADVAALVSTVKWGSWFGQHGDTLATLFNVHASVQATGASSGMSVVARAGNLEFGRRWRSNFVDRNSTPASTDTMHVMPAGPMANQWQAFVMLMRQSPNPADSPFCTVWHRPDGGVWSQLFDFAGPIGYTHADPSRDLENFGIGSSYYQYHANNPIAGPRTRELHYGGFGLVKNPTQSVADLQAHADSWMPA